MSDHSTLFAPGEEVQLDSAASWRRLLFCAAISTIGGVGMWSAVVVLPAVQAEFAVTRGAASLAYTAVMLGFALGSVLQGRLVDRFGIRGPLVLAVSLLSAGYVAAGLAKTFFWFALAHFVLIGLLGGAVTFAPLMAHVSLWFARRRGIAVALLASGSYIAGAVWPPILQAFTSSMGWRATYVGVGAVLAATLVPLGLQLRQRPPIARVVVRPGTVEGGIDLPPRVVQALLVLAGLACCFAMATPQVHIVAYCADLGYGPARGAEMLSAMLAFGIVSRVGSGWLADRIGGLRTLLLGSILQGLALLLYVQFTALGSLFVISALFGLFQGGIVPSYAVVVRQSFPAQEAGGRIGLVIMATMIGMAAGGWLAGAVSDWTGSYRLSFAVGVAWNAVNLAIVTLLVLRWRERLGGGAIASSMAS